MPVVHVYIAEGRPADQKRDLAKKITNVVIETIKPSGEVSVYIHEESADNISVNGVTLTERRRAAQK